MCFKSQKVMQISMTNQKSLPNKVSIRKKGCRISKKRNNVIREEKGRRISLKRPTSSIRFSVLELATSVTRNISPSVGCPCCLSTQPTKVLPTFACHQITPSCIPMLLLFILIYLISMINVPSFSITFPHLGQALVLENNQLLVSLSSRHLVAHLVIISHVHGGCGRSKH